MEEEFQALAERKQEDKKQSRPGSGGATGVSPIKKKKQESFF